MRIEVVGEDGISQQARAYAEYRVFACLAPFSEAERLHDVNVLLQLANQSDCESIACTVTVALAGSNALRIRAIGPHAYAAINQAVDRIAAGSRGRHASR